MFNPMMNNIQGMLRQGLPNPQAFAQQILQNNPQFAQMLQGQNPQALAMNALQGMGINPNSIMQMLRPPMR